MKKNSKKDQQIEYRDLSYPAKRHDLRELALKSEIANCVDTVTDDIFMSKYEHDSHRGCQ